MTKRGRRSTASLSVVTTLPGSDRPQPPKELKEAQAAEWRAIVGRMPAGWFTRETHGLLIAYCRHRATFSVLSSRIDTLEREPCDEDVDLYNKLLRMREREGRAMSSMATRLRLTQQARYNAKSASTASKDAGGAPKPWEFSQTDPVQ